MTTLRTLEDDESWDGAKKLDKGKFQLVCCCFVLKSFALQIKKIHFSVIGRVLVIS